MLQERRRRGFLNSGATTWTSILSLDENDIESDILAVFEQPLKREGRAVEVSIFFWAEFISQSTSSRRGGGGGRPMPDAVVAHLVSAWYFWISLLVVSLMLLSMTGVCVVCCCHRDRQHSFLFGRIFIASVPVLSTARDPEGIIRPDVAFYPARCFLPAQTPLGKDRLTTPIMPLNPAYQPAQQVAADGEGVASSAAAEGDQELILPPGYVVHRDAKYQ